MAQSSKYEFRGVWIATVTNIDWPSKSTLTTEEQKAEFIRLLDLHRSDGMNAIVMQIRPASDAFYPSALEPWSSFLTGTQGRAPNPYYDPLQFFIEETHKRGMEFHAWLNPYRAVFNIHRSSVAPNHVTKQNPGWFINYGNTKYFDPGNPNGRKWVTEVVKDIVSRYDVDAIHMDDYFYPYKIPGKEFPDHNSYRRYAPPGMSRDDWRRSNCDSIIKNIKDVIHATNPTVRFGISPFGIWRNKSKDPRGSATRGLANYDDLYADILLWLEKGWIDYVAPQLYWETGHNTCDFETLVRWWNDNSYGRQLYIGHAYYKAGSNTVWKDCLELPDQILITRDYENVNGSVYYSSRPFLSNPNGWNDSLRYNYYSKPSLVKPMNWLDSIVTDTPVVSMPALSYDGKHLKLKISNIDEGVKSYAIYYGDDNRIDISDARHLYKVIPAAEINKATIMLPKQAKPGARWLKITAISYTNHESPPRDLVLLK